MSKFVIRRNPTMKEITLLVLIVAVTLLGYLLDKIVL